jgi:hypothetical protein
MHFESKSTLFYLNLQPFYGKIDILFVNTNQFYIKY